LADIPVRARGVRRLEPQPHCGSPFLACITRPDPLRLLAGSNLLG
jgi:hypothetical protein